ncbi:adenylate cyclase [Escherichia coli]|uniref:adenylate cyclase n=1 Tax=Escherichia coli TaxID=562 RepID=UPI00201B2273|nr:adenylate cyclase [Escherichia coli]
MTNGWDPKYDPTWIKYAEVNRNDIIREGMKPSNIPGTAGDIGGSIGSELGGKVTDKVLRNSRNEIFFSSGNR